MHNGLKTIISPKKGGGKKLVMTPKPKDKLLTKPERKKLC